MALHGKTPPSRNPRSAHNAHSARASQSAQPLKPAQPAQSARPQQVRPQQGGAPRAAHSADRQFRAYDATALTPKKRSKAPAIVGALLALVVVAALAFFVAPRVTGLLSSGDVELLPEGQIAIVVVEEGQGAKAIGQTLADAQLVPSANKFVDRVEALGASTALIPGTYQFQGGMTMDEIIEVLKVGPAATADTITIPEGFTRERTAARVEEATGGRITARQFLDATADASAWAGEFPFLESAGTNHLEGFLFPKTYSVTAADDVNALVRMMLRQFQTETASLSLAYPEGRNLSLYDALNLASIVEKEAAADNRLEVASVFYNRLAIDMPLQSDATTAYEVGHDPTPDEVHADTPYGTYANYGLPPTPICSPSIESLQAVCNPAETSYLYFYFTSNADGSMNYYFSETYDQHLLAIANG